MPPSPAMRISPGRAESHKRGRSLESGIRYREKDDDLALFSEVQNKERENFLLQSSDDFDDIFSTKLRHFSDGKLEISIPARGESSDLLYAEGDKNDYDWLITPPETPLFPSLDDETPQASLVPRGRPRSQPITISRSSTMEKGYRSARSSASPHRLSPSPRSGTSPLQSRSKPFSATHSSPPPTLRHSSPSRKLSPPPSKSSPAPRSSTPTPRRMSTGSPGSTPPSRVRGTSPIKSSRGNSASPKIKAWQSNIPGFSSEAPPNLRTSLADRPASYVRGSSPASRNGRQSMSPIASRSVSSSHSHDQDRFSSQSKGSVASSGDDDVDSLQSNPLGSSDRSAPRGVGSFQNNRVVGFSKKPTTKILSSSAPKRSFDMALRQMDRKGPQNMFRPLLSSVPSSTFYAGKASALHHRSLISRNSSITTSSNGSSDLATNGALDTEESEQNQEDVTSDFVKAQCSNVHDEVFVMNQPDDALKEDDVEIRTDEEIGNHSVVVSELDVAENSSQLDTATAIYTADVVLDAGYGYLNADGTEDLETCSICARGFPSSELLIEGNLQLCQECKNFEVNSTMGISPITVMASENSTWDYVQVLDHGSLDVIDQSASVQESLQTDHSDKVANEGQYSYNEPSQDQPNFAIKQKIEKHVDSDKGLGSNSNTDVSEGMGISLLLKRSSSGKGHIVQNRSLTATSISYDDLSYVRDSVNSMRSSIGYSSASVSSSIDMGSSRQTEMTHLHRQPSWLKSDMENYRYEMPIKHKRSASSLSGASTHAFQVPSVTPSCLEDCFEVIAANTDGKVLEVIHADPCEQSRSSECAEGQSTCANAEGTSHLANFPSEEPASHGNDEISTKTSINLMNEEISATHFQASSEGEDDDIASSCGERMDVAEVPYPGSLDAIVVIENDDTLSADSQSDGDSTNSKSCMNELMEPSVSVPHDDVMTTVEEFDISDHAHGIIEESTIVLGDNLSGTKSRSLTLEEATDTILFCSSIVHNLAYEAANIAIDKESQPIEALRPTLPFVGKSNSDRREMRSRATAKRGSKSQKTRQKKLETDQTPAPIIDESTEKSKSSPRIVRDPSKDDSMKPPKLESKCNCIIM